MHHLTHTEFRITGPDVAPRARRIAWLGFVPIALLALAAHVPVAHAQAGTAIGEQLHASAVASFRQARFSEAYGRFIGLADAGHAPAAAMALWMYLNGSSLFGKEWDSTQEQLTAWAQLARQPAPVLVGRAYPQPPRAGAKPGR